MLSSAWTELTLSFPAVKPPVTEVLYRGGNVSKRVIVDVLNIPNTLTIIRIAMIPVFITSIIYSRYDYALYLFIIAALTDVFDGLFARMKNQRTPLGTFLDPLADKFLLVTSFVIFSVYGWIPKWLAITVISRDIIVVTGWFVLYFITGTSRVDPSMLGKATIWFESLLIAYILIDINLPVLPDIPHTFFMITAGVSILSALHYMYRGLKVTHRD
jgi:cardiolipin synthase (CMP-forming)